MLYEQIFEKEGNIMNNEVAEAAERGTKIMVVDDQAGIRMLLEEVFKKEGYSILTASNGNQALEIIEENNVDLVLLDMKIPGMSGLEILKKIKQVRPDLKVMVMTAYGESDIVKEALRNGAMSHFSKPFDLHELITSVEKECPQNECDR